MGKEYGYANNLKRVTFKVDEKAAMAEVIGKRLLERVTGNKLLPTAWRRVAKQLGIDVETYNAPNKPPGHCSPALLDEIGAVGGTIFLNLAYSKDRQARVLVHELAHLYLVVWNPPITTKGDFSWWEGALGDLGHDIACRVVGFVFGD